MASTLVVERAELVLSLYTKEFIMRTTPDIHGASGNLWCSCNLGEVEQLSACNIVFRADLSDLFLETI